MILVQSLIVGTSYQIKTLEKQSFESKLTRYVEDLRVTGPIAEIAKYPLGTVFITDSYDFPDDDHLHINKDNIFPLFYESTVFPIGHIAPEKIQEFCDYAVDYMIDHEVYGNESAKLFAEGAKAYGYTYDWDAKTAPKPIEELASETGSSLKRSIASTYPIPDAKVCGFHIDPDVWFLLVRNVIRGENQILIGPTGSGKTEIVSHLARVMGKEMFIQDMGTVQDAQSALLGVHRINKEGVSSFENAPFVSHIQSGGIVLLDELSRAPLAANNVLFPCLDKRRYLPIDIACDDCDRRIDVHENTVFIATANIGSEYSGTQSIDRALLDRFFIIEIGYPEEQEEVRVLMLRTGAQEKAAKAIVKVANEIRKQYKEQELTSAVSVRHTLQAASLTVDGFEIDKAIINTVMPLFEDGIGVSERSKVLSIISAF